MAAHVSEMINDARRAGAPVAAKAIPETAAQVKKKWPQYKAILASNSLPARIFTASCSTNRA